jgi:hypothetical protein
MYIVSAESRLTGALEYCSPPMTNAQANELASALRRLTQLRVTIDQDVALQRVAEKLLH